MSDLETVAPPCGRVRRRRPLQLFTMACVSALVLTGAPALADGNGHHGHHHGHVDPDARCRKVPAIAHRGAGKPGPAGDGIENTIYGWNRSRRKYHVRYVETDLQETRDGVLVLFHDRKLRRTTGEEGYLRQKTYANLPPTKAGHRIPKLAEAFDWAAKHNMHMLIEIKEELPWRQINKMLDDHGLDNAGLIRFDTNKVDGIKHGVARDAQKSIRGAGTGVKSWPKNKSARWLGRYGNSVRVDPARAADRLKALRRAGITQRYSKMTNRGAVQWSQAVRSGAIKYMLTEYTGRYYRWCRRQQD